MTNNNYRNYEHMSDDEFIDACKDEIWERLSVELFIGNALGQYARRRRKRLQKWIAAGCTVACLLTIGGIFFSQRTMPPAIEPVTAAPAVPAKIPANKPGNLATTFSTDSQTRYISESKRNPAVISDAATARTENAVTVGFTQPPVTNLQKREHDTLLPVPDWQLVTYPFRRDSNQLKRQWPIQVDHNDILNVIQRRADKIYEQKLSAQKDSASKKYR
ncbi:hypothetical protein [Ferruginibacter sp. HRS2-29]|uniref:hypothetical protein n=1 Tax=Ferruginibacter sp. HRS2-29 TaxID=2487334 RepID=UPI0020CE2F27|nr:hypothetical protein [Ferruginibacter sp. HRS2-29]MCP9749486.1 hypothetical protein [Ferruginibacter sp. HRS2-29]